jgi:hypothetical protein
VKFTVLFMILLAFFLGCTSTSAWADAVAIQNASFEITNPLDQPCRIANPGICAFNFGPIPDWTISGAGPTGSWRPSSVFLNLPLPDGSIVAYSNGGSISQTLTTGLAANTTYVLSVFVGHRLDDFTADYTLALYAGNTLLDSVSGNNSAIPLGTFADQTLTFESGATPASGDLRIVLTSGGEQVDFDDVSLTATATPEPGTLLLLGLGLTGVAGVMRRKICR